MGQGIETLEIDRRNEIACWRWRKLFTAATLFLVPSSVDRALRAIGFVCVEHWRP